MQQLRLDNLIGLLFNSLLAELPAILDSFYQMNTTSDYIGMSIHGTQSDMPQTHELLVIIHTYMVCSLM